MRMVFRGAEAEQHEIDLSGGAEALAALGRIANLVGHYVATKEVRFRGPYDSRIRYVLKSTEEGSFAAVIQGLTRLGDRARSAAMTIEAGKLFEQVIRRGVGKGGDGDLKTENSTISEGDIDVLVEASEPALKRMHGWIDTAGKSVTVEPDASRPIRLDQETRAYLVDEIVDAARSELDVSVAAINVNQRSGRVYMPPLGRTVPFRVPADAEARTIPNLSRYLVKYADHRRRRNYDINAHIKYKNVKTVDDRVKRIMIYDCEPLDELI